MPGYPGTTPEKGWLNLQKAAVFVFRLVEIRLVPVWNILFCQNTKVLLTKLHQLCHKPFGFLVTMMNLHTYPMEILQYNPVTEERWLEQVGPMLLLVGQRHTWYIHFFFSTSGWMWHKRNKHHCNPPSLFDNQAVPSQDSQHTDLNHFHPSDTCQAVCKYRPNYNSEGGGEVHN